MKPITETPKYYPQGWRRPGPNLILCALVALSVTVVAFVIVGGETANAAGPDDQVTLLNPVADGEVTHIAAEHGGQTAIHNPVSGLSLQRDWSMVIAPRTTNSPTPVYANFANPSGSLALVVTDIRQACGETDNGSDFSNGGRAVWLEVRIDGDPIGVVSYQHLAKVTVSEGDTISAGTQLGVLATNLPITGGCWVGASVGIDVLNYLADTYSCHAGHARGPINNNARLGVVGGDHALNQAVLVNAVCDTGDYDVETAPSAEPELPSGPLNLAATAGDGQATLTWNDPEFLGVPEIRGYEVYALATNTKVCAVSVPVTSCRVRDLTNDVSHAFEVRAINDSGYRSASVTVTPSAGEAETDVAPKAPTGVTATGTDSAISVTWDPAPSEASVTYRASVSDGSSCEAPAASTGCVVAGLTNGVTYLVEVSATNAGVTVASDVVEATPQPGVEQPKQEQPKQEQPKQEQPKQEQSDPGSAPAAPKGVVATALDEAITVEWNAPGANAGPVRHVVVTNDVNRQGCEAAAGATTCTVTNLVNGTPYLILVQAINDYGIGESETVQVTPRRSEYPAAGTDIVVRAIGESGTETFDVSAGDTVIGSGTAATAGGLHTFSSPDNLVGEITVTFTNDLYNDKGDRNLTIDYVRINGTVFQTEADSTYSEGTWGNESGCAPAFGRSEQLSCGGSFNYGTLSANGTMSPAEDPYLPEERGATEPEPEVGSRVLKVRARGTTGGERFALRVGSTVVEQVTVSRAWRTYRFHVDAMTMGDVVVGFMNDSNDGVSDFNLQVDWLSIGGSRYETEAATTWSNIAGDGPDCTSGHRQSEYMYCNGAFYYTEM